LVLNAAQRVEAAGIAQSFLGLRRTLVRLVSTQAQVLALALASASLVGEAAAGLRMVLDCGLVALRQIWLVFFFFDVGDKISDPVAGLGLARVS
jgi:hypothetical protein